ncbi:MAG: DUF167 family protein [Minisyncoccia bacterium]
MQYIHVKVVSSASQELFRQKSKDHFEIFVKEKAERNMANARVIQLLALHFKVAKLKIRIVNGHHHPSKLLVVED